MRRLLLRKTERLILVAVLIATLCIALCSSTIVYGYVANSLIQLADSYTDFAKTAAAITEKAGNPANTLLVVSSNQLQLDDCDGIIGAVSTGDGMYVIGFSSHEYAEHAFSVLEAQGCSVEYDRAVAVVEGYKSAANSSIGSSGDYLSWGAAQMNFGEYRSRLLKTSVKRVLVAVLDSGADLSHSFLAPKLVKGYDFCDNDSTPNDEDGHGTHVAGTVADCTRGVNTISIMPIRVLDAKGNGEVSDIANGILYAADKGADVMNLSMGGTHSDFLDNAIAQAIKKGCVVVTSAGNENDNIDKKKICPAHIKAAITVGGVSSNKKFVKFSNFGKYIDCAAPGIDILSSYPKNSYAYLSGTSMAAPHVTALVAMAFAGYGHLSKNEVESLIIRACDPQTSINKCGHGIVSMNNIMGSINNQDISIESKVEVSKSSLAPKVIISRNGEALFPNKDYTVQYDKSRDIGTKELIVKGIGTYSGELRKNYEVVPQGSSITKLTATKAACTIKWRTQKEKTNGYQIRYSKKSSMSSSSTKLIKSNATSSCKISKLKSKTKYYFQIRTYKNVNGKKYYSKWSGKKSVKIK